MVAFRLQTQSDSTPPEHPLTVAREIPAGVREPALLFNFRSTQTTGHMRLYHNPPRADPPAHEGRWLTNQRASP